VPDIIPPTLPLSGLPSSGIELAASGALASLVPPTQSKEQAESNLLGPPNRRVIYTLTDTAGLEAELFEARARLKLLTSQVAMHLKPEERRSLFGAIDRLLGLAEWEEDSVKFDEGAFRSFLRFTIYAHPRRIPSVGIGPDGALLTGWHCKEDSVHVEFLAGDQCIALIKMETDRGTERIAFRGHVARLRDVLENNGVIACVD
jgi:hypothetical protein